MPNSEEPNLYQEVRRTAWIVTKVLMIVAAIIGPVVLLLKNHTVIATWVICGITIVGQIVYYGWRDYKWKKKDWDRRQEEERQNRQPPRF